MAFVLGRKKIIVTMILVLIVVGISAICISPRIQYWLGNQFFGAQEHLYNVDTAQFFYIRATRPIVGTVPEFAHYQLSRTYFIQGFFQRSIEEAQKELTLYPENKRTFYILGLTYGYLNQEEKAIDAFSEFIMAYPDSWAARNDKAWLQFRLGDLLGALETIEPVATNLNPWVQNTYGTILLNLGREEEARQAFLHAEANAQLLTPDVWGRAYPGNDPRIYEDGLEAMRQSIDSNKNLIE